MRKPSQYIATQHKLRYTILLLLSHIVPGKQKSEAHAESEPLLGYNNEPKRHAKKDRHCLKRPVQSYHQIPRQVCVQVPRQVCVPYEVKVPYEVCGHSHVHVEQYANDFVFEYLITF